MITPEHTLELAKAAYRDQPDSPQYLSEFSQAFWNARRVAMGVSEVDLVVADCPYSADGLRQFTDTNFGLFLPRIVSTAPEGLILLGKAFPRIKGSSNWAFNEETSVSNVDEQGQPIDAYGWMKTEKGTEKNRTLIGATLNVYVAAGQQSKELTGQYVNGVYIRTLYARERKVQKLVLHARFELDGYCSVNWQELPGVPRLGWF